MINEKFKELYERLLQENHDAWNTGLPESQRAEACFQVCLRHWGLAKELVDRFPFRGEREEIDFFRNVKPWFTGRLEFYTLVYQFLLFCPGDDPTERADFCVKELGKMLRYRESQAEFIRYFNSGETDQDREYFLRIREGGAEYLMNRIYDKDQKLSARMDVVLAELNAYDQYEKFLKWKMRGGSMGGGK